MAGNQPEPMALLEPLLAVLASMIEQLARLTKLVLDLVRDEAICRQLMTSPVGGLPAATCRGIAAMAS